MVDITIVTIVNGDYFMVYKPTNITGGPHSPMFSTNCLEYVSDEEQLM